MRTTPFLVLAVLACCGVFAATDNPNPQGQGQGGGQRWDPAQMQQRMLDRIKTTLAPTDDEWKILQPRIEELQKQMMQARVGGLGGFGRRRQNQPDDTAAAKPKTELETKVGELQALVDQANADPKAITAKLQEVRDLREKAKVSQKKAQDDLKELLTPKQEAQLVMMGLLE